MFNAIAGTFMGIAAMFGGFLGLHVGNSSQDQGDNQQENHASTTPWGEDGRHMGSTTPGWMGTTTPGIGKMGPGIAGKVASINGTTITVTGRQLGTNEGKTATTTYIVDASAAHVVKAGAANASTTLASLSVGTSIFVTGDVSGTNVTAKLILIGVPMGGIPFDRMGSTTMRGPGWGEGHGRMGSSSPMHQ